LSVPTELQQQDPLAAGRIAAILSIANSEADRKRRSHIAELLKVWGGNARHLVKPMPSEDRKHFALKPKLAPPLLSHALRQISFLYDIPPHRLSQDQERWESLLWSYGGSGLNGALHSALPLAKLCGQVHAWYRWTRSPNEPLDIERTIGRRAAGAEPSTSDDDPGVIADLWTSDQVIALPLVTDQRHAKAIMLMASVQPFSSTELAQLLKKEVQPSPTAIVEYWHYLDDVYYAQIAHVRDTDVWHVLPRPEGGHLVPHGLPEMPVQSMPWRYNPSRREYWVDPWGGDDLLPNLGEVYTQLSEYMWTARLQRGQPVGRGIKGGALSPDTWIELGADPVNTFTIIPNQANLTGMKESVTTALELLAKTLGLPSRTFRLDDVAAMSGLAIALDAGELEDQRRGDEQTWRRNENAAHGKAGMVIEARSREELTNDVSTTFSPLTPILTQEQRQTVVLLERQQQTMSKREMKVTLHPDLDEQTIDKLLEEAEKEFGGDDTKTETEEQQDADAVEADPLPNPQTFPEPVD
jgi:hypothetical protein